MCTSIINTIYLHFFKSYPPHAKYSTPYSNTRHVKNIAIFTHCADHHSFLFSFVDLVFSVDERSDSSSVFVNISDSLSSLIISFSFVFTIWVFILDIESCTTTILSIVCFEYSSYFVTLYAYLDLLKCLLKIF